MYLPGRIVAKRAASPTVTLLDLSVPSLQIQPGQWPDFRIPSADWIGGYSLAKKQQKQHDVVQIAVKQSTHAPAAWVTHESKVGDEVSVQAGGNCLLHSNDKAPAVFVAGGIGISPMLSLYQHHVLEERPSCRFYYSISTEAEFVFLEELSDLVRPEDALTVTVTQSKEWQDSTGASCTNLIKKVGREHLLPFLLESSSPSNSIYYVCGPPSLQDFVLERLKTQDVPCDNLVYEKWW